jgi:hypothetical protein
VGGNSESRGISLNQDIHVAAAIGSELASLASFLRPRSYPGCRSAGVVTDMRLTSDTLAGLTFNRRAVSRTPRPSSNARRMRCMIYGVVLGPPRRLPDALARSKPAITRSRIIARSNSLNTQHAKQRPTRWRAGVEGLLVQIKIDVPRPKLTEQPNQVGQGSAQAAH